MKFLTTPKLALFLIIVLLNACTSAPKTKPIKTLEASKLISGELLLGRALTPIDFPNENLFEVTPEMALFADTVTQHEDSPLKKTLALHKALIQPLTDGGQGIKFDAKITESAPQTFAHKSANCLSFSILFVALTRHLNLDAYINEVDIPPSWDMFANSSMFFMLHVNALVRFPSESQGLGKADYVVIDLQLDQYRPSYTQRRMSKEFIDAQYYSNKSTEALAEGDKEKAFIYISKALQSSQHQSYLWNNLAIIYRRNNLLHAAELAYLQGLAIKPHDLTIMNNLSLLYRDMNQPEKYEYYSSAASNYRRSNPYQEYSLASSALGAGDAKTALVHIQQALNIENKEKRFYQLASTIYRELDQPKSSADMDQQYDDLVSQGY